METKRLIKIAICVIVAALVLIFGIEFLKGINLFKSANYYYASYTDVEGLNVAAPITLNGFKVGQVRDIQYEYDNPGHVKVELSLDKKLKVPKGSAAMIESDLLGTASIVLKFSEAKDYYEVGATIEGTNASGLMDAVNDDLMPTVATILPKVDSLITSLNTLVANPALTTSINRLDNITANIEHVTAQLNKMAKSITPALENVNLIANNLNTVSNDLTEVSSQIKGLPIEQTMQNVESATGEIKTLTGKLNSPESSLGLLLNDKSLYNRLDGAAGSLDSLLIDVKKNPKRYISIKLF